jgi:hypothetical protein
MNDRLPKIAFVLDLSGPVAAMSGSARPVEVILREEDDQERGKS